MDFFLKRMPAAALAVLFLYGCDDFEGSTAATSSLSNQDVKINREELQAIRFEQFTSQEFAKQECFGRIMFDINSPVQWPTYYDGDSKNGFSRSFSENVFNSSDVIRYGEYEVAVFHAPDSKRAAAVKWGLPKIARERYLRQIDEAEHALIEERKAKRPSENSIANYIAAIADWKKSIKKIDSEQFPFDTGMPESEGFSTLAIDGASNTPNYSVFHAYLTRGEYIYVFRSSRSIEAANYKKKHETEFSEFLKNFRPRNLYEIPNEIGVCIPHGFIRDNGKISSDMKQSLRAPDALGVLYTIHTGSVEKRPSLPAIKASVFGSVGNVGTNVDEEVRPFITERLGPRPYRMGGVSAMQGGIAARITGPGVAPYETYQVFTGYQGFPGSESLPFIYVELNTTTTFMAPELKHNPPPFKQSMARYESLLRSIRLRPTVPPMAESSSAAAKLPSK